MMPVHQWTSGASTGDAITGFTLALRDMIRGWGVESDYFADYRHVSFDMRKECRDVRSFPDNPPRGSTVIYHFSIGSSLTGRFLSLPEGVNRIVCYHNITPPKYFRALKPETADVLAEGRRQLLQVAPAADLSFSESAFNLEELRDAGGGETALVPLLWEHSDTRRAPDENVLALYDDRAVNWLFVGRIAPNKKIEDVIRAFAYYRKTVRKHSRLFLVGSFSGLERYYSMLRALTVQLDLPDVVFTGHVTAAGLSSYFELADLFVCMSEHEGFCLPLLEAMSRDVPVLAYHSTAVPETVGEAGIVFSRKDFPMVAELAEVAVCDEKVRNTLVAAGRRRLEDFSRDVVEKALKRALAPFLYPG